MNIFEFDSYEVYGVKEIGERAITTDEKADYYTLYGLVIPESDAMPYYTAIGDYDERLDAEVVAHVLDNKKRSLSP